VIDRAADYINNKYVQYWPSTERVPLLESRAVGSRHWQMIMPLQLFDEKANGYVSLFNLVLGNMQSLMNDVVSALRPLDLSGYTYGMFQTNTLDFVQQDPEVETLLAGVNAGVMQLTTYQDLACFGFMTESEATVVVESPETILILEGISCAEEPMRIILPVDVPTADVVADSVTAVAASPTFNSALELVTAPMMTWVVGDTVYYQGSWGTSVPGTVRSYDPITGEMTLDFVLAGVIATFGGGDDNARVYGMGSANYAKRFVRTCAGAGGALTLVFDWDNGAFPILAGSPVRITSALQTTVEVVEIDAVTVNTPFDTEIDVTTVTATCDWDAPVAQPAVSLAHGGFVEFVW
jgi:hypothetical protein